jgi:hypothetical protein
VVAVAAFVLVAVLDVAFGFNGVIDGLDVVADVRVSPVTLLPELPLSVPTADPPLPAEAVDVGANVGPPPATKIST